MEHVLFQDKIRDLLYAMCILGECCVTSQSRWYYDPGTSGLNIIEHLGERRGVVALKTVAITDVTDGFLFFSCWSWE